MAAPTLVGPDMTLGMEAAKALWKDEKLRPTAAFWLYDDDAHEWRYFVASADVHERGPTAAYLRIRNILKRAKLLDRLPLRRVVVADPSSPFIETLSNCIRTPDDELASAGFADCVFNDFRVSGMYVYLLKRQSGYAKKATLLPSIDLHSENEPFRVGLESHL